MAQTPGIGTAKDQLIEDFGKVVADTEALLRAVASVPGDKASTLRASVEESLGTAKQRLRELQGVAKEKTAAAAKITDEYVHENPWPLIAGAAVVGFVVGLLCASDRR